jgi:hypothetical protein
LRELIFAVRFVTAARYDRRSRDRLGVITNDAAWLPTDNQGKLGQRLVTPSQRNGLADLPIKIIKVDGSNLAS